MNPLDQKVVRLIKEPVKGLRKHMNTNLSILENDPNLLGMEYQDSIVAVLVKKGEHTHTSILFPPGEEIREELLEKINFEAGVIPIPKAQNIKEKKEFKIPRRIIFHNRQAIGDIIMFTCAIRDFKRQFPDIEVQVQSTVPHMWDHNPNINRDNWPVIIDPVSFNTSRKKASDSETLESNKRAVEKAIEEDKPVKLYIGPGRGTNASNRSDNHFANAYRISIEAILGVKIEQGPIRGDLYMTEEEYNRSPIIEPPYWLITAGEKGDWTAKTFPFKKWEEVVKSLPEIKFVQIGAAGHKHPKLGGPNVINYIGKTEDRNTGFRGLLNLFNYCEGSAGLVSFQMHLAAVFNKPCVVIAGAREPVWFTRYPGQQYLATDGCLPCTVGNKDIPVACWKCDINGCPHISEYEGHKVPLCENLISSSEVVEAIQKYYKGGRLSYNRLSGRSKLINVVKSKLVSESRSVAEEKEIQKLYNEVERNLWGFSWGGSCITDKDWGYIEQIIKDENIKSVFEIGAGLSTFLFTSLELEVISLETRQEDIDKLLEINPELNLIKWDGRKIGEEILKALDNFDAIFVDGPGGGKNREPSFIIAKRFDKIFVHDAGRETEKLWIEKHLSEDFGKHSQGGHRTAFYKRKVVEKNECQCEVSAKPKIKVLFNGRGEGGAEGSVTWIMNEFVRRGWEVDYLSPNENPCGTYRKIGDKKIRFSNDQNLVQQECDILFLYTNDWVWEFPKLESLFKGVKAKRKVMSVNFRLGRIGVIDWTKEWDKYLFLNSSLEKEFLKRIPGVPTKSFAPPVDLTKYFENTPNYEEPMIIVRHSSQGDAKYPKDFNEKLTQILYELDKAVIHLMPAPTFLSGDLIKTGRVVVHKRNDPVVNQFLSIGNVFWYHLPQGYHDQGPKVIMEAQASGLPVVADNHSGAADRVVSDSGFLCNDFNEVVKALKELSDPDERRRGGQISRDHARKEYNMKKWIEEIIQ